jgi:prepilin-type processing-associated H-X9-DG protein
MQCLFPDEATCVEIISNGLPVLWFDGHGITEEHEEKAVKALFLQRSSVAILSILI